MSAQEKAEIIALVTGSELPCRRALAQLGLSRSTYYRWLKRQTEGRLLDLKEGSSLLDLACSQGVLARQIPGGSITRA